MHDDEIPVGRAEDLTGKQFGEWIVLYRTKKENDKTHTYWKCKCSCGNEFAVKADGLKSGKSKKCRQCQLKELQEKQKDKQDLTGQIFGQLIVIEPDKTKNRYWKCKCSCGAEKTIRKDHLLDGSTISCGCYNKLSKIKDMSIGEKFGRLTILRQNSKDPTYWDCLCNCGNTITVKGHHLRSGHTQSCGCLTREIAAENGRSRLIDLTGQRFGQLTVIEETPIELRIEKDQTCWKCLCDCGNIINVSGYHLKRGDKLSCGCRIKYLDIAGQKFGKLTAISRNEELTKEKNGHSFWNCQCDCGNTTIVYLGHLQNGHTTSCGCDKSSRGEKIITKLLEDNQIQYIHDKQFFKDLILPSGGIGRYDFVILNKDNTAKYIIEFDGEQHFKENCFNKTLKETQDIDIIKNQYSFKKNIPLIRIPYWEKNNLTIEDLIPETSKYLIKGE